MKIPNTVKISKTTKIIIVAGFSMIFILLGYFAYLNFGPKYYYLDLINDCTGGGRTMVGSKSIKITVSRENAREIENQAAISGTCLTNEPW